MQSYRHRNPSAGSNVRDIAVVIAPPIIAPLEDICESPRLVAAVVGGTESELEELVGRAVENEVEEPVIFAEAGPITVVEEVGEWGFDVALVNEEELVWVVAPGLEALEVCVPESESILELLEDSMRILVPVVLV